MTVPRHLPQPRAIVLTDCPRCGAEIKCRRKGDWGTLAVGECLPCRQRVQMRTDR